MKSSSTLHIHLPLKPSYIYFGRKLEYLLASLIYSVSPNINLIVAISMRIWLLRKTKRFLHFLIKRKFSFVLTIDKPILNFSTYNLSDCKNLVLSRGLIFYVSGPLVTLIQLQTLRSLSNNFFYYLNSLRCPNKICLFWRLAKLT